MKRDMEKVRSIMLALEAQKDPYFLMMNPTLIGGVDNAGEMVEYLQMLSSGGMLEVTNRTTYRISWSGHEFLDKVRDDEIWRKTKDGANKIGSWSVKLLGEMASCLIRAKAVELGIPLAT